MDPFLEALMKISSHMVSLLFLAGSWNSYDKDTILHKPLDKITYKVYQFILYKVGRIIKINNTHTHK